MIWPSVSMAHVTAQNRQLMGRPASMRAIQAAFKKQDKSCGAAKEENSPRNTVWKLLKNYLRVVVLVFFSKDTEPSLCNT